MANEKEYFEASVRTQFILLTIFWWIGFPLSILGAVAPSDIAPSFEILSGMAMAVTTVFWCILLYRHWFVLQGHGARTTPGRAVGFGFIPVFCFYWWFVAYAGLATDTNRYLAESGIAGCRMSRGLAIADSILSILGCTVGLMPAAGAVILVPYMFIGYILVVQQRNCVLAILNFNKNNETN